MRRTLLLFWILLCLTLSVSAADGLEERFDLSKLEHAVPSAAAELLRDANGADTDFGSRVLSLLRKAVLKLDSFFAQSLRDIMLILAILVLAAIAGVEERNEAKRATVLAGILAIMSAGAVQLKSLLQLGEDTLMEMQGFSDLLLPVITSTAAASGNFTASGALYFGATAFSALLLHLMTAWMVPMLYVFLALRAADAAAGSSILTGLADLTKWTVKAVLKVLLFTFTGYMTLTGILSGAADATAVKAAKLTLSGVVPIVGSMISDASEAVIVSAGTIRNTVGVFGLMAVLAICILPFFRIGIQYLLLRVAAAMGGTIGLPQHVSVVSALSEATGLLLAMTGTGALLMLVSCVCYLQVRAV